MIDYNQLKKDLTEFFNKYPDATDCIEDTVHDILIMVKENVKTEALNRE